MSLHDLIYGLKRLLWRARESRELDEEIQTHLEMDIQHRLDAGTPIDMARGAALREFGNVGLAKEVVRDVWGWGTVERMFQDLNYALRILRKSPAFTITAILSLALGIGANTAIFSLVDAVLLRSLPVQSPEDLVLMMEHFGTRQSFSFSSEQFRVMKENDALDGLCAFRPWKIRVTVNGESQLANGQLVSGNYFSLLGVHVLLGRTLIEEDDRIPGGHPVAVLSYSYWRRQFGSDRSVIGRIVELQGYPFTVVGVSAPEFVGLEPGTEVDLTVPLMMQPVIMPGTPLLKSATAKWLRLTGRRKQGISLQQAQANLSLRWSRALAATPRSPKSPELRLEVLPGGQGLYDLRRQFSLPLRALMGAVSLVLLVACANLASLLLARATTRRQEFDLRLSLGASRGRLVRQLLTESILLSAVGGVCGTVLAYWGSPFLVQLMSRGRTPLMLHLAPNARAFIFTAIVSLTTGLLFGVAPALCSTKAKSFQGSRLITRGSRRWTGVLICSQVALCLIVLISAGLLLGSLQRLRQVDLGFRKDHVLLMSIRPSLSSYKEEQAFQLYDELYRRFSALPGVQSVTLSMDTPLGGISMTTGASTPDSPPQQADTMQVNVNSAGPRFFETMGIPLLSGRDFTSRDDARAPQVAVITESAALALFPGANPLGKHILVGKSLLEVVGVAKDTLYRSVREKPQPMVYRPYQQTQGTWGELFFSIRSVGDPEQILGLVTHELHEAAPDVPPFSLSTLEDQVDASLVQERMVSALSAWFGGFALLLACIGLYGRLSYTVTEQTREIGIRLALGARRTVVMWAVLREILVPVLCGVAIGLPLALAATRAIRSLLFGLSPSDPLTLGVTILTTIGVACLAGYFPAHRASCVDPMVALRYE
jgi:predicted permease